MLMHLGVGRQPFHSELLSRRARVYVPKYVHTIFSIISRERGLGKRSGEDVGNFVARRMEETGGVMVSS